MCFCSPQSALADPVCNKCTALHSFLSPDVDLSTVNMTLKVGVKGT